MAFGLDCKIAKMFYFILYSLLIQCGYFRIYIYIYIYIKDKA